VLNDKALAPALKEQLQTDVSELSKKLRELGVTDEQITEILTGASKDRTTFRK
jgi:SOS response regulatory protein OraA/RecX